MEDLLIAAVEAKTDGRAPHALHAMGSERGREALRQVLPEAADPFRADVLLALWGYDRSQVYLDGLIAGLSGDSDWRDVYALFLLRVPCTPKVADAFFRALEHDPSWHVHYHAFKGLVRCAGLGPADDEFPEEYRPLWEGIRGDDASAREEAIQTLKSMVEDHLG